MPICKPTHLALKATYHTPTKHMPTTATTLRHERKLPRVFRMLLTPHLYQSLDGTLYYLNSWHSCTSQSTANPWSTQSQVMCYPGLRYTLHLLAHVIARYRPCVHLIFHPSTLTCRSYVSLRHCFN